MARTLPLTLAVLMLYGATLSRAADADPAAEIVRSGTAQDATANEDPRHNDSDFDFRFRKGDLNTPNGQERFDPYVAPAGGTAETAAPDAKKPRRLAARSRSDKPAVAKSALAKPAESLITVGGSLCVVLSLFFGLAWLTRRGLPKQPGKLPGEVIEVLGKAPLVKGQELQLIRVGAKLLLICVTPSGCEMLTEIVEHGEVDRLSTICRSNGPSSMTAAFNQVLTGIGREPATGFAGSARTQTDRRGGRAHA